MLKNSDTRDDEADGCREAGERHGHAAVWLESHCLLLDGGGRWIRFDRPRLGQHHPQEQRGGLGAAFPFWCAPVVGVCGKWGIWMYVMSPCGYAMPANRSDHAIMHWDDRLLWILARALDIQLAPLIVEERGRCIQLRRRHSIQLLILRVETWLTMHASTPKQPHSVARKPRHGCTKSKAASISVTVPHGEGAHRPTHGEHLSPTPSSRHVPRTRAQGAWPGGRASRRMLGFCFVVLFVCLLACFVNGSFFLP